MFLSSPFTRDIDKPMKLVHWGRNGVAHLPSPVFQADRPSSQPSQIKAMRYCFRVSAPCWKSGESHHDRALLPDGLLAASWALLMVLELLR